MTKLCSELTDAERRTFYGFSISSGPRNGRIYSDAVSLLTEISAVTKQETVAAEKMATLPEMDQPHFWETEFRPLLEKEETLRQKMLDVQQRFRERQQR